MKITGVRALPETRLHVTLANGKTIEASVAEYLAAPGYKSLRDERTFARVAVQEWGHAVEWPGDIAIPVSALYRLSQEQAGQAFPVEQFNAWMQRNSLSAAQAARALGLTRRTIIYYHTGGKPIPVVVGLACEGYDARQKLAA
jgi:transcriptional regulator with GAF, ATPase, and Fis domain